VKRSCGWRDVVLEQGEAVLGFEGGSLEPVGEEVFLPANGFLTGVLWVSMGRVRVGGFTQWNQD
jgi:hypothetical protein